MGILQGLDWSEPGTGSPWGTDTFALRTEERDRAREREISSAVGGDGDCGNGGPRNAAARWFAGLLARGFPFAVRPHLRLPVSRGLLPACPLPFFFLLAALFCPPHLLSLRFADVEAFSVTAASSTGNPVGVRLLGREAARRRMRQQQRSNSDSDSSCCSYSRSSRWSRWSRCFPFRRLRPAKRLDKQPQPLGRPPSPRVRVSRRLLWCLSSFSWPNKTDSPSQARKACS